jgi:hypothetical protein
MTTANGDYTISDLLEHGYSVTFEGEPLGYQNLVYREADSDISVTQLKSALSQSPGSTRNCSPSASSKAG